MTKLQSSEFSNSPFLTESNFSRKIPYSYFSSLVSLTETTQSTIFIVNPYIKPTLRFGDFSFHAKFFAGYQLLETNTTIKNDEQENNQQEEDEPDYIAKSKVSSDGAFDYGVGLGMRFPIFRNLENAPRDEFDFFENLIKLKKCEFVDLVC